MNAVRYTLLAAGLLAASWTDWKLRKIPNRLTVPLPAGVQGTLRVRFVNWPLWRVCDAVSLLTLMAAVAAWVMRRRKRMRVMQSDSSCAR